MDELAERFLLIAAISEDAIVHSVDRVNSFDNKTMQSVVYLRLVMDLVQTVLSDEVEDLFCR